MKRTIKWFLASIALLVLLYTSILIFGVIASHETGKRWEIGYGASTSPRPVRLEVGDKVFVIPQNHIWSREDWKGGKVHGVNLQALLPDFAPYTETNRQQFDKPGWHDEIDILLTTHNTPGAEYSSAPMGRSDVYRRIVYDYATSEQKAQRREKYSFNLDSIYLQPPEVDGMELYVATGGDGSNYWIRCYPEEVGTYPSCSTYLEYSSRVTIQYTFSRTHLRDWKTIDAAVVAFIGNFEYKTETNGEAK